MSSDDEPFVPFSDPILPLILLFGAGLLVGIIIALRNCCTTQLLPHHIQKKIARGGILGGRKKDKEETLPFIQQPSPYGTTSVASTRLFEDLYRETSKRKEKSGRPPKLPKVKKISVLHGTLCTNVTKIEQTLPMHIRTHSSFPVLSLVIQDYVTFVRNNLIPTTTKFITFCNDVASLQATLSNMPPDIKWQSLGTVVDERINWMRQFADEVMRNSGELQVMSHKMFKIINAIYEEMRMSSVTQNMMNEASKTEYVFHLLSIFDCFKKMAVILQFARDEVDATAYQLSQVQRLVGNESFEGVAKAQVFNGKVAQALANDAKEQQQQAEALVGKIPPTTQNGSSRQI